MGSSKFERERQYSVQNCGPQIWHNQKNSKQEEACLQPIKFERVTKMHNLEKKAYICIL